MDIEFSKMHGLGNDFVVIDGVNQSIDLSAEQIRFIANRRFGVGCDQLLLVESPDSEDVDFRYRIFNADGGEVEQCGNGARCFARFVREQGLTDKDIIPVSTSTGNIVLQVMAENKVRVNMGVPRLKPGEVPFFWDQQQTVYNVLSKTDEIEIGVVSMGNPHAVIVVDDVDTAPVETLGPDMENHARFPNRVNVGFMQILNQQAIKLRVYERGAGETMACGTGACAAMVSGKLRGLLAEQVTVSLPGGELDIEWQGIGEPVYMTGPAETVFTGRIIL